MKTDAIITKNRQLTLYVNLQDENAGTTEGDPNVWVKHIDIFNTESYLDGVAVFSKDFKDYASEDTNPVFLSPFTISDHDMNIFDNIVNTDNCHSTDILNDIIIVDIEFGYDSTYEASHTCSELVYSRQIATYWPCDIYSDAINKIDGLGCDVCEENLPYGFMYALLKKKAVDASLESGDFSQACRYYIKFYKTSRCGCVKKSCGCGCSSASADSSSNSVQATISGSSRGAVTKNCGCHA